MITVVSLNPSYDWQYSVPNFAYGGLNRVACTRKDIGGKGINVCVALNNLGLNPLCTGFNFNENGDFLTSQLDNLNVKHDFINVNGAVRVNIKLYEGSSNTMTELNQQGSLVTGADIDSLCLKIEAHSHENNTLVLSGSRPQGVGANFYAQLCKTWKGKVFLDTDGEALKTALKTAAPYAIKPNLFELESTFDVKLKTPKDIATFCKENIITNGVSIVCVSMGSDGAVLVTINGAWFCPALKLETKGVQGAGDSMVAGLLYALYNRLPENEYLSSAMAAASASVILDGTAMCGLNDFNKMFGKFAPKML